MQVATFSPTGSTVGLQCVTGFVNLFRFITVPQPGTTIGTVTTLFGERIPLIQTVPTPLGGTSLASVDGQNATVCGVFVRQGAQTLLDVRVVNPGAPSPTGTPAPFDIRLLILLLLLLSGRFPFFGTSGGFAGQSGFGVPGGLGNLGGLLGSLGGLQGLQGLLGTSGIGADGLAALLQSLLGQRQV